MIQFSKITLDNFLQDYWQKKPLLLKNALPNFQTPISPEELAGLSLEEEVESRLIIQKSATDYSLKTGPFSEEVFEGLPKKNWTLLIQGLDRLMPEVTDLLKEFSFIPSWRVDDIMVSYATQGGNVGPHFDHYDVFLLQAQGKRNWQLTSQNCDMSNYIQGVDLRLMQTFNVEDDYVCETGDILYLPPKWGHHGISLSDDCMTFSIGYRSYQGLELWDSFGDYLAENESFKDLYLDPNWQDCQSGEISDPAWQQAKKLLKSVLEKDEFIKPWFGKFATQLDKNANDLLPEPLAKDEKIYIDELIQIALNSEGIIRDEVCRFAYAETTDKILLYINGQIMNTFSAEEAFIKLLCNQRVIDIKNLTEILKTSKNHALFEALCNQQAIRFI